MNYNAPYPVAPMNAEIRVDSLTRVLIIDDDPVSSGGFVAYLENHGFQAKAVSTPDDSLWHFTAREPDLVILDLHVGHSNGFETLRAIRSKSDIPLIVITRGEGADVDRVVCLELGADDCVTNPIAQRELVARIRAVLRRWLTVRSKRQRLSDHHRTRFGGWMLNHRLRTLTDPAGSRVDLSKSGYALLVAFLDAPQRALSREHLLRATRIHEDILDRSLDVAVFRLRQKLERDPTAPRIILTERGVGYTFMLPVEHLE